MSTTEVFQNRVIDFLHSSFPDSVQMEQAELREGVAFMLEKATHYGLQTEIDQVNYVVTAYLLGLNFDTEMPAATEILTDKYLSGTQKADWLQQWTQQLFQVLAEGQPAPPEKSLPSANSAATDMQQYLDMQMQAGLYHALAEEVLRGLMQGHAAPLRSYFSTNFLNQIGIQAFEQVCAELLLPFFVTASALGQSSTITYTTDAFGNTGFAFYRTVKEDTTEKPFIIYMVEENGRIVVANLVINKTYADMH